MGFLRLLPIFFLLLFILTRRVDVRVIKNEAFIVKISFNILALVLTEDKVRRKNVRKITNLLRSFKVFLKSIDYLISKSTVNVFRCDFADADKKRFPILYSASFYASVQILIYYLTKNSKKINYHDNQIFHTQESRRDFIDLSIHFSLWNMIISALLLLYYIVKNNVKRALKNV